MSVYKRILVATDFSDINRLAVERASILAKQDKCELILLHVIEHFPMDGGPLSSVFKNNIKPDDALAQHVRARMSELVDTLEYQEIQAEFRITSKSARHEILRFAQAHAVDLIVYWSKRDIAGLLLMPATRHNIVHLNEALRIKKKR